jgi:hypothetical protein
LLISCGYSFLDEALALGFNPLIHVAWACGGASGDTFCMRHDGGINWRYDLAGLEKCRLLGEPANRFAAGQFLINFRVVEAKMGRFGLVCSALNFSQLAADTR